MGIQVIVNLLVLFFSVLFYDYINKKIIIPLKFNTTRHELFKLRDDLAMIAMSGKISETSKQYKTLMNMINGSIAPLDTFKITDFIQFVSLTMTDKRLTKDMDDIMNDLKSEKLPEEFKVILNQFMYLVSKQYNKYVTRLELLFIVILIALFRSPKLIKREQTIKTTKTELSNYVAMTA